MEVQYEYIKELYALAIDDTYIWAKCPFIKTNYIHRFKNPSQSLLNSEMEREIEENVKCPCDRSVIVNVGDYTERISLKNNKKNTSYIRDKKTKNKFKLLYKLEKEGRRKFHTKEPAVKSRKPPFLVTFP